VVGGARATLHVHASLLVDVAELVAAELRHGHVGVVVRLQEGARRGGKHSKSMHIKGLQTSVPVASASAGHQTRECVRMHHRRTSQCMQGLSVMQ
jgi:hypothetical protein